MTEETTADLGPGQQLKLARERKGFTVADISARLKLNTWIIEGIEQEDYTNLPAPTFLRGYLRSYGSLVGLDGNELVRAYNRSATIEVKPLSMEQPEVSNPAPPVPVAKYFLILLVLGGLLFATYWFAIADKGNGLDANLDDTFDVETEQNDEAGAAESSSSSATEGSGRSGLGQPSILTNADASSGGSAGVSSSDAGSSDAASSDDVETIPVANALDGVVVTPLSADDVASLEASGDPVTALVVDEPAADAAASAPTASDTGTETDAASSSSAEVDTNSAETAADAAQSIEPAPEGFIRINFTLAENAWIQVLQRYSKRVVSRELDAGKHEFVARLPVRMKIGNAKNVTLMVDGQPWRVPNRNVARIKIFKKPEPLAVDAAPE